MSPHHLGRGRYLLQVPSFQHLLSSPTSGLLLVDGHCKEGCEGKVSPISVFCASLAAMMAQNSTCMILHFFAGQHCFNDPHDPARGPLGLMRTLICQVLLYPGQPRPNLDWVTNVLVNDVAAGNIDALCCLFKQILQYVVGVSDIFCILDSISEFERKQNGWGEDLDVVFDHLSSLNNSLPWDVCFKLLITSAEKSSQLAWQVSRSEHVSLRAGNLLSPEISERAATADIQRAITPDFSNEHSSM